MTRPRHLVVKPGYMGFACAPNSRGMILVVTLAIIVLVTVAVLAFFSQATANRQVEAARTNRTGAGLLSLTAQDYITAMLMREITDPANSDVSTKNGVTLYFPKASTNAVARRGVGTNISLTDTNFFNLIRQSVATADPNASSHNTADSSRNGRIIPIVRWNSPQLLSGGGFAQTNQLPCWIYVTRSGGITPVPTADVIGRFAYNIYDIGGLLDVSASGYPTSVTNTGPLKFTVAGADLTQLPGFSTNATAANTLVTFRNRMTNPTSDEYLATVAALSRTGFLTSTAPLPTGGQTATNNALLNRQDLLRYVRLQNPALTDALPYLTHFSRTLNAPTWRPPATPANTNPNIPDMRFPANASITHYDDYGNTSTYSVKVGEPFVQRRFSLAKLAWLTPEGPSALLPSSHVQYNAGGTPAAIQACFGLKWDDQTTPSERWNYVGPTGTTTLDSIKTLAQVAAEPSAREPNFFELLKAGILDGSLGAAVFGKTYPPTTAMSFCHEDMQTLDSNKDLHILQIAANIIDSADTDNYPTVIALNYGDLAVEKAGVEDLPYFYALDTANLRNGTLSGTSFTFTSSDYVCVPELLNPHRAGGTTTSAPASLQIKVLSGILRNAGFGQNGGLNNVTFRGNPNKDLSVLPPIPVPPTSWETYRSKPAAVRDATATNRLDAMIPGATDVGVLAFRIFSHGNPADFPGVLPYTMNNALSKLAVVQMDSFIVGLQYQTPGGRWKTYGALSGYEALPEDTGIDGIFRDDFDFRVIKFSDSINNQKTAMGVKSPALLPADPRSSRFGPWAGRYKRPLEDPPRFSIVNPPSGTIWNYSVGAVDFFKPVPIGPPIVAGNLPQRAMFEDPDTAGNPRVPDANIGFVMNANAATNPGSTQASTAANPYGNLVDVTRRPVILQRPYRNVAELGYVFRDTPWQTLNFWNSRSADAALLDLFSVRDEPAITAGRVALNTPHVSVIRALLNGTPQEFDGTQPLPSAQVNSIATALQAYSYTASGTPNTTLPTNLADLVGFMSSTDVTNFLDPITKIKYRREAVVRGLASGQTRTWNFLMDIVTQSGRFPTGGLAASNFQVTGETHSWLSVAIDRITAKIVDSQSETVNE